MDDYDYLDTACDMLGVDSRRQIPYSLKNRLNRVDGLCRRGFTLLRSIESIAIIVEQWQRDNKFVEDE